MCCAAILCVCDESAVVGPCRRDSAASRSESAIKFARYPLTILTGNIEHANVLVLRRREGIITTEKCDPRAVWRRTWCKIQTGVICKCRNRAVKFYDVQIVGKIDVPTFM